MRPHDPIKAQIWIENLSKSKMGAKNPNFGKSLSEKHRDAIRNAQSNRIVSEETCEKIRISKLGPKNPRYGKPLHPNLKLALDIARIGNKSHTGIKMPEHVRLKLAQANLGRTPTEETRKKLSEWQIGYKNHNWKGGIKYFPYCEKFNDEFKERVRKFFNYQCVECGLTPTNRALSVHHVNFDKQSCCNESEPLFVALCQSCHSKTHKNRDYWQRHFTTVITRDYDSKCYIPKAKED